MTDQHDARDALKDLLYAHHVRPSCQAGASHINRCRCVSCATERASAIAATQPTKPEQQAGGVPAMEVAGWRYWTKGAGFCLSYYEHEARDKNFDSEFYAVEAVYVLAAPSQSAVQPLSEAQHRAIWERESLDWANGRNDNPYLAYGQAVERAHGIKEHS